MDKQIDLRKSAYFAGRFWALRSNDTVWSALDLNPRDFTNRAKTGLEAAFTAGQCTAIRAALVDG